MDRSRWGRLFSRDGSKSFPCPQCGSGEVQFLKDSLNIKQPQYNSIAISESDDFDHDWIVNHFICFFQCVDSKCGEILAVSGDTEHAEVETEHGWGLEEVLRVQSFFPAPPIIRIPKEVPFDISVQVQKSFSLYWIDYAACAARIRGCVEEMLNERGVPTTKMNSNGSQTNLKLNDRIDLFKSTDPDNADFLHALRLLGNIGAHETDIEDEKIMDAYEILESVLSEVYEQKTLKLKSLRDKIINTKGKY